ncbi:SMRC1 protein, partial [Acrocephalus arundinaceus]|nr:SMRC1 protein [Acrocephalus arundinaceus]
MDFKAGGTLCHILGAAYKYKNEQGWRRFDLQNPSRMDRNVEMFMNIEKTLNNCLSRPTIYLIPDMELKLANKLKDIVKRHQGTVTEEKSKATHHVYPSPTSMDDDEWLRPVMKKDKQVLVHWGFFPDSYDTWVHANEIEAEIEDPPIPEKPWKVHAKWILDTDVFNEWMKEEDYEVDENRKSVSFRQRISMKNEEPVRSPERRDRKAAASTRKRKHSPSPPPTPVESRKKTGKKGQAALYGKRRGQKEEDEQEDLTKDMEDPTPVPNIEEVVLPKNVNPKKDSENTPVKGGTVADLDEQDEETVATGGKLQKNSCSQEARVEQHTGTKALPPCGVAQNPCGLGRLLSCPRSVSPQSLPCPLSHCCVPSLPLVCPLYLCSFSHCRVPLLTLLCPLYLCPLVLSAVSPQSLPCPITPFAVSPLSLCPLTHSAMSPHCQLINICVPQFDLHLLLHHHTKTNMGNPFAHSSAALPEQALCNLCTLICCICLLQALEMYKDDWNKVSEHVGSRTQDECILQFLRLPIEDPYLENSDASLGPLAYQPVPFSQSGNPVMSTVAFLASVVDPRVASAAAKAALEEFSRVREEVPLELVEAHVKKVQEAARASGKVDPTYGLESSCIAGTGPDEPEKMGECPSIPWNAAAGLPWGHVPLSQDKPQNHLQQEVEVVTGRRGWLERDWGQGMEGQDTGSGFHCQRAGMDGRLGIPGWAGIPRAAVAAPGSLAVPKARLDTWITLGHSLTGSCLKCIIPNSPVPSVPFLAQLEQQRQQLLTERQNFHMEQLKYAELRARQQMEQQHSQNPQQPHQHPSGPGMNPLGAPAHPGLLPHQQPPPYPMMHHQMPPPHPPQPGK